MQEYSKAQLAKMKRCKECEILFVYNLRTQNFCNQKCMDDYNVRNNETDFPLYICQNPQCGYGIKLNFFPIDDPKRFMNLKCEKCDKTNVENN